jgi:hypothetical protein
MGVTALAMLGLWWNARDRRLASVLAAEGGLVVSTLAMLALLPESQLLTKGYVRVRLAMPEMLLQMTALLAAAWWFTSTPWPGFAAVACLMELTIVALPRLAATGALALEGAVILGVGMRREHRYTQWAGWGLLGFAAAKLCVYDWGYLSPTERTLGLAVAGLLLYGVGWRKERLEWQMGGLAIWYGTAYGARALPALRCLEQEWVGVVLQVASAGAGVWTGLRFAEPLARTVSAVALAAAFVGVMGSQTMALRAALGLGLTGVGMVLAEKRGWREFAWVTMVLAWMTEWVGGRVDWEIRNVGKPLAWVHVLVFLAYEIRWRLRGDEIGVVLWSLVNAGWFCLTMLTATDFADAAHVSNVAFLAAAVALGTSVLRWRLGVRQEATSEALALAAFAFAVGARFQLADPLALLMAWLLGALAALAWNRRMPTVALTALAELLLGVVAIGMIFVFPESEVRFVNWIEWRLALPQMLVTTVCLFAAGRWLTYTPWPSGAGLLCLAVMTLWTFPETAGTIVLAVEAVLAVGIGLVLARRHVRLGGLCLFVFSVLKVFFYDLSTLEPLARIFSFIVLGLLLIGASWGYSKYRQQLQKYL